MLHSESLESRDRDTNFAVVSVSVSRVSLRLLEHQPQAGGDGEVGEEEEGAQDEPESISVPVHGLGTVNILSAPVSSRRDNDEIYTSDETYPLLDGSVVVV